MRQVYATLRGKNKSYSLTQLKTRIGSSITADIRIVDESVHRHHAEIHFIANNDLTNRPCTYSPVLKVLPDQIKYSTFVNNRLITGSTLLSNNDIITFGLSGKHVFEFRVNEKLFNINALETPNVSETTKCLKRNLIDEFDHFDQNAKQFVEKYPKDLTVSIDKVSTPSCIKQILNSAQMTPKYSPSIGRFFRQINSKSSKIISNIEKIYEDSFSPKSNIPSKNLFEPKTCRDECNDTEQNDSNNLPEISTVKSDCSLNHSDSISEECELEMSIGKISSEMIKDLPSSVEQLPLVSSIEHPQLAVTENIELNAPQTDLTDSKGIHLMDNEPHKSTHIEKIRKLIQTPKADYTQTYLNSLRFLYQKSPFCDYNNRNVSDLDKLFSNSPPKEDNVTNESPSKQLLEVKTPKANYRSHVQYIDNISRIHQQIDSSRNSQSMNVRDYFQQVNVPRTSHTPPYVSSIRSLFQPTTPLADYDKYVDSLLLLERKSSSESNLCYWEPDSMSQLSLSFTLSPSLVKMLYDLKPISLTEVDDKKESIVPKFIAPKSPETKSLIQKSKDTIRTQNPRRTYNLRRRPSTCYQLKKYDQKNTDENITTQTDYETKSVPKRKLRAKKHKATRKQTNTIESKCKVLVSDQIAVPSSIVNDLHSSLDINYPIFKKTQLKARLKMSQREMLSDEQLDI